MKEKIQIWLKENFSNLCGFLGTLAMSFSMAAGDGGQMDEAATLREFKPGEDMEKYIHHFVMLKHPIWNQVGLILIGVGFLLPVFLKLPFKRIWAKYLAVISLMLFYSFLIFRLA